MEIPLVKGDTYDSTVDYRDSLPVNMYAVMRAIKGTQGYMNQFYGLTKFVDGVGVDRGGVLVSRTGLEGHYRVSGTSFIKVNTNGTTTVLGAVTGSDQCSFAYSFDNIAIVGNGRLYYYNPTNGFREITDPIIGNPIDIVWADGVFILTDGEGVFHSDVADENLYRALDFSDATFRPDPSLGLGINEDNELLVFGKFTIEPFRNIGAQDFIFRSITSKYLKLGCVGTQARKEMNGFWYVVGRRKETAVGFHQIKSGGEKKLSSREIDKVLAEYDDEQLATVTIDAFTKENVKMILIHLPDKTILFNETIAENHGSDNAFTILKSDTIGDRTYRARNFIFDGDTNEWIGGDKLNSNIGYLDETKATHYDEIAEWLLYTPIVSGLETASIDELELNTIAGFSPDNDATVFYSTSETGLIFSQEYTQLYTDNHNYNQRFIIRPRHYVRDDVAFKFRGASRSRMNFSLLKLVAS
tara:strand:+ start:19655 stop:21064 length:1410 start_codon:yes stop_codon:yes gene_type:complete